MNRRVRYARAADRVGLVVIDNPPMNAMGPPVRADFMSALDELEADGWARAAVISGAGRAFCGGDDLKSAEPDADDLSGWSALFARVEGLGVPTVAAVNGWCVGGGFELALCCDVRIAASDARFACAGVNVGLLASAYRLPRLIGAGPARHMLLTGLPFDAEAVLRFGAVTEVVAPDGLMGAACAIAARVASRAPLSIAAVRRIVSAALDLAPDAGRDAETEALAGLRRSEDHREALRAFRSREEPRFEGR